MTYVDKHAPGSFCWIELATTDQRAAKAFYGSLFGWTAEDSPIGEGAFYTMFQLQGRTVAAGYALRDDQRSMGVPPNWMVYITVTSADATAKKAAELGGTVVCPAFDVATHGRMAVIKDPTGAHFSVWQPINNQGIGLTGVEGTLCWEDLSTPDVPSARQFYSKLFGWEIMEGTEGQPHSDYLHIKNGEEFIGGVPPAKHRSPGVPPHWLPYFFVNNCDATAAKAKQLGASLCLDPMTMEGVGRMAVVSDPQGAVFAIFQAMPRG